MDAKTTTRPTAPSDLLTTREACAHLNISRPTLYLWARRARISRVKTGRLVRWPRRELDRLVASATRVMR